MWVVALYYLAAAGCVVGALPAVCSSNDQCSEGYYCEKSGRRCIECLQCADLKREPPSNLTDPHIKTCVKSLVDCGPCLKGLVADLRGDVNAVCVSPESQRESPILPVYSWVLIAIAIAIVMGMAVGYYLYRKPEFFKASISNCSLFVRPSEISQTAPDSPPPYNPDYDMPNQVPPYAPPSEWPNTLTDDTAQPFIKRAPSGRHQYLRNNADNQRARMYEPPCYERQDDDSVSRPEPDEDRDKYSPASPWPPVDEETVESVWTPHAAPVDNNQGNANKRVRRAPSSDDEDESGAEPESGASRSLALVPAFPAFPASPAPPAPPGVAAGPAPLALPALPAPPAPAHSAEAGDAPLQGPSPAKRVCIPQVSGNNRHPDSTAGPSTSGAGTNQPNSDTTTALFINVVINNNK